ncbi:MAG: OmpA family protein [Bacteroidota bacterium]|nr:OmpA family protein [Bacteroidota bacterium]
MKLIFTWVLFLTSFQCYLAQNLIADSSFEQNKFIPLDYSAIGASTSWNSPTRATTDLFCTCNKKDQKNSRVNVPNNSMGNQQAHSGKCYAGIFAFSHGYYREYLQTSLAQTLQPNKEYVLSLYISLSDYSRLAIDNLGVCFLDKNIKYENSEIITNLKPLYIPLEEEVGMDTKDWHQLTLIYKAKGGENTIVIGGFGIKRVWQTGNTVPKEISSPINKSIERDAYYYIDDVSMYEYKPEIIDTTVIPANFNNIDVPDTVIVEPVTIEKLPSDVLTAFKNVLFESGESTLSPPSYPELNIIVSYMKVDPKLKIEIFGHTDNAGDESKNLQLSIKRAVAIGEYLVNNGVRSSQVTSNGFGSSKPIASNETPEGRKQNRRVEFILKN